MQREYRLEQPLPFGHRPFPALPFHRSSGSGMISSEDTYAH
jgi:hypothetical protein